MYSCRYVYILEESQVCACNQRTRPSYNINMINILYKQKAKSSYEVVDKEIFERHLQP